MNPLVPKPTDATPRPTKGAIIVATTELTVNVTKVEATSVVLTGQMILAPDETKYDGDDGWFYSIAPVDTGKQAADGPWTFGARFWGSGTYHYVYSGDRPIEGLAPDTAYSVAIRFGCKNPGSYGWIVCADDTGPFPSTTFRTLASKASPGATAEPTPSPTAAPTASPTSTKTSDPTATPDAKPSATPTPSALATPKPTPKPTPTPTAKPTPKPTPSAPTIAGGATCYALENGRLAVSFPLDLHGYSQGTTTVRVYLGMESPLPLVLTDTTTIGGLFYRDFANSGVGTYECRVTVDNAAGHAEFSKTFQFL